jgi:hypothetical protein
MVEERAALSLYLRACRATRDARLAAYEEHDRARDRGRRGLPAGPTTARDAFDALKLAQRAAWLAYVEIRNRLRDEALTRARFSWLANAGIEPNDVQLARTAGVSLEAVSRWRASLVRAA